MVVGLIIFFFNQTLQLVVFGVWEWIVLIEVLLVFIFDRFESLGEVTSCHPILVCLIKVQSASRFKLVGFVWVKDKMPNWQIDANSFIVRYLRH